MGNNVNKKFTVSLDISTADAEKQVKASAEKIKDILSSAITDGLGVKEFRDMANTINKMFEGVGKSAPIDIEKYFKGNGSAEKRIEILTDALDKLSNVMNKTKTDLGDGGGDGTKSFSNEVQTQIDTLNRQIKDLEDIKSRFQKLSKTIKSVQDGKPVPDSYKVNDLSVEAVQTLISEFDNLKEQIESGDKSSIEYYNNLAKIVEISLTLKNALRDVRADDTLKQAFMSAPGGPEGNMLGKLSAYASTYSKKMLDQATGIIDDKSINSAIKSLKSQVKSLSAGDVDVKKNNEKSVSLYDKLISKVQEYYDLVKRSKDEKISVKEYDNVIDQMEDIETFVANLGKTDDQIDSIMKSLRLLQGDASNVEDVVGSIANILGVKNIDADNIEDATSKLQEFLNLAKTYSDMEYTSELDVNAEIKKLEELKTGLIALAEQGKLTTQNLNSINTAFDAAESHLKQMSNHKRDSSGDNKSEANQYKNEAQAIEQKNEALKEHNKLTAQDDVVNDRKQSVISDNVDKNISAEAVQLEALQQKLVEVKQAVEAKTQAFEEEYVTVDAAVDAEIASLNKLKALLEEIQGILQVVFSINGMKLGDVDISQDKTNVDTVSSAIQGIQQTLGQILSVLQGFTGIESDGKNSIKQKEPVVDNGVASSKATEYLASKLSDLATESTLAKIPGAIEQLANAITTKGKADDANNANTVQSLNALISALSANISSLKEVMDGVVVHQKAQKSDTKKAMARIQDPTQFKQISSIAENSIGDLGTDVHIKGLKALANGLVGVEGAFKNVNGEWEGFTVKVNESNNAVDLAINKQSAFAKVMQKLEEEMKKVSADANDRKLSPDATANHAIVTANGYDDEGKEVTVQYKDSQRYTVSLKENIGGLQKEVFQTFDDSIEDFNERTTVTVSNKTAAAIRETNKLIEENEQKVGNVNLLQEYNVEYKKLLDMNDRYRNTSISDVDIEAWNKQITLVQTLGNEVSGLIKQQQKLDNQAGVATSAKRLQEYQTDAGKIFNELDFGLTTASTDEQKAIVDTYDKIIEKIDLLKKSHSVLTDSQIAEINQLVAALKTQSDAYLDAKKKENEKDPGEQLKQDKDYELDELQKYQNDVEKTAYMTKELSDKIDGLKNKLGTIQSSDELDEWRKDLGGVRKEIDAAKSTFELLNLGYINAEKTKLTGSFNQLNGDQKLSIQAEYEQAIATLEQYKIDVQNGKRIELDAIDQVVQALRAKMDAYKEANKEAARDQKKEAQKKPVVDPEKARVKSTKESIKDAQRGLDKNFGKLDFDVDTQGLSDEQQKIADKYKELGDVLKKYSDDASQVSQKELNDTLERVAALQKEIDAYKQKYNIKDANGGAKTNTYGSTQVINATAKYNSLVADAKYLDLTDDSEAVKNYTNALQELIHAQNAFRAGENLDSDAGKAKVQAFKDAQTACAKYARELNNVVTASKKLESEGIGDPYRLVQGEFDLNDATGRQSALRSYIDILGDSVVAVGNFTDGCNKLHYTIKNGDGTFTAMTATINKARTAIVATAGDTENATGKFASFFNELKGKFKSIGTYFMASFGIEEVWQQLRQGVQYVREIDSALTELKKVTNETDASYDAFLQSMSKTGSVIGATVQDLTTMAADWARLNI